MKIVAVKAPASAFLHRILLLGRIKYRMAIVKKAIMNGSTYLMIMAVIVGISITGS